MITLYEGVGGNFTIEVANDGGVTKLECTQYETPDHWYDLQRAMDDARKLDQEQRGVAKEGGHEH